MPEETTEKKRFRSAGNSKYPVASVISDPDVFHDAVKLLKRSTAIKVKISELDTEMEGVKEQLAAICEAYELAGIRHGLDCFEYYGWQTKETLSKERLLELGVPAATIAAAYAKSKPFLSTKVNPFDTD